MGTVAGETDEIVVTVDPRLAKHAARFAENRRNELGTILDSVARGDFHAVRMMGHNLKGAGGGFGMMPISDLGRVIETAAIQRDAECIRRAVEDLRVYLARVRVVAAPPVEKPPQPVQGKRKILVVDDDRDIRDLLRGVLGDAGYDVEVVPNGLKLVRALRVDRPDLILLDVMMSWINGFDLCRAIKQNHDFSPIPIIFISARSTAQDVKRGLDCGADDYLTKPLDIDHLLSVVGEVLDARQAQEI